MIYTYDYKKKEILVIGEKKINFPPIFYYRIKISGSGHVISTQLLNLTLVSSF
jgi:hypothetical protein